MQHINILTRRAFLDRSFKTGMAVALSTLVDVPFVVKRALAEGNIGLNGKKLLFIFLRGANDALNSVIPILDSAYNATNRPNIMIPADTVDYSVPGACFDPTQFLDVAGTARSPADATFAYAKAVGLGNGFAALHPSLKFLAPVYNAGDLALVHRVAYPRQSRSHFDSQDYWETGTPNNNLVTDGIFYRTMLESGLANSSPLTGVSIQSSLPLSLRGSAAAMTNLNDPTRYNLLSVPTPTGDPKADGAIGQANQFGFPDKLSRELLNLQYQNMLNTLQIFASINFGDSGNTFVDNAPTDGDTAAYYLFPTSNQKNGGYTLHANDPNKYVVDTGAYGFFTNLKAASIILNKTDAIVAGTEYDGFDTHQMQVGATSVVGGHANLLRRIGWAMYALRKYFTYYADKATWNNLIVVTLSEFGRTTVQNTSNGTDHAEGGVMFLAGGGIKGYNKGNPSGVFGCSPTDAIPWVPGQTGSMFGASSRYLKRAHDYRSVLGKIIRDHLGATPAQLARIIPGYGVAGEHLQAGGTSSVDGTPIMGEPNILV